ncbi:1,4-alpha-glucan branching protein GlgB [Paraflavisolibacter sp. H34]|uniref:1,4-alpha-glucan branching protein GlgB n=1 Tax=Huijunlia imazamoxiresistens TaxID=3127457 RepID=UPI00301838A4
MANDWSNQLETAPGRITADRWAPAETIPCEEPLPIDTSGPVWSFSLLTEDDIRRYQKGTHETLYRKFGATRLTVMGKRGYYFCVWAPCARTVSVVGDFNGWGPGRHPLFPRWDRSGIWEGFIPGLPKGALYKYQITGSDGSTLFKGDPYARYWEHKPKTASITWETDYHWNDAAWMEGRARHNALDAPWSVYEVHLASWMRPDPHNEDAYNSYRQTADLLVPYVQEMGFTHVELMPVMEYPFDGSWGYQLTGYYAPTSRFGPPEGLMYLIDRLHQAGIGVILDWVPSHFPYDAHGLFRFDGAHTYEYADMRKGYHPDWSSYIFNYGRHEVKSFLISNAHFWFDLFHIDAIRVDAVSSMLRLDYSRGPGQWEPNEYGGTGNLEAMAFFRDLNASIYRCFRGVQTIAEESTDWPAVSGPVGEGGLGFGMKWMMGWMHDTLDYFGVDPLFRPYRQGQFRFSMEYYYHEKFLLPLSHDEVVHGKAPLLHKMPGDRWQQFAHLRVLYTYMWTHPGARLLFMGCEFGQTTEWNYKSELDWGLLQQAPHAGLRQCVRDLNALLRHQPALYADQFDPSGFEWVDTGRPEACVFVYRRRSRRPAGDLLVILNLTPEVRWDWEIELEEVPYRREVFNSDAARYGGTGLIYNPDIRSARVQDCADNELSVNDYQRKCKLIVNLPPLAGIVLE